MKLALCLLLLAGPTAHAGLEKYSALVVADAKIAAPPRDSIRVTYLGVNGYRLETGEHVLLIDPYFTRANLWSVALHQPIASQRERVDEVFAHIGRPADAVLVTHAHFDHLLDVPDLVQRTSGRLVSGPSAINLARSLGVPREKCDAVSAGNVRRIGPWTIHVLSAKHDRLFGSTMFPGEVGPMNTPPRTPSDWKLGEPLAFMIGAAGKQIYIDSGGLPGSPPMWRDGDVDLAILGVALPDSRRRLAEAVRALHPRFVLPSHQDDFFRPLRAGFTFGKMSNFPDVRRTYEREQLPGRLILLDYFRPWTLP